MNSFAVRSMTGALPPARPCGAASAAGLIGGAERQLRGKIFEHAFAAALAAEAALAIAAEAAGGVEHVGAVDPDDAGLELRRDMQREVDVLAPHRGGEAVARVVGELDRFLGGAEGHGRQHRAEHLFLRQDVGRRNAGRQRRQIEIAASPAARSPAASSRAPCLAPFGDQPAHAVELGRGRPAGRCRCSCRAGCRRAAGSCAS